MSGNTFGRLFKVTTFGESHGVSLGVIIDGCPAGLPLTQEEIQKELNRRRPGQSSFTTPRQEADCVKIQSGVFQGLTTGTPIALIIENQNNRSADYDNLAHCFRPGHGDKSYFEKYGIRDFRGGGRSSGRETAARVAAGAVAKKILKEVGVEIHAWVRSIGPYQASECHLNEIEENPLRCCSNDAAKEMQEYIKKVAEEKDSVGGVVECLTTGVPSGWGEPVFDKIEALLAYAMLSIGGVKGFEIGSGFQAPLLLGSQNNQKGHSGGVLGGISDGEDLFFRLAVKPTPSIFKPQECLTPEGTTVTVSVKGRHDPCLCPRIVPVVEAMNALVLVDLYLQNRAAQL